jgi:hypothetical protein
MLEALPDVLAREVSPEDFLDGDGCPLLHILHPFSFHLSFSLCLSVLDLEVPLAVGIQTQSLLSLWDLDHVRLFVLSFLLFEVTMLFGVEELVLVLTALPLLFVSSKLRVLLTDDDLLLLLRLYYRLDFSISFSVFLLMCLFLLVDYLWCAFFLEVSKFLLFLGWFGDL